MHRIIDITPPLTIPGLAFVGFSGSEIVQLVSAFAVITGNVVFLVKYYEEKRKK